MSRVCSSGWVETGAIRYNTLEPKNFKRVLGRGDFTYGSMTIQSRDLKGNLYDENDGFLLCICSYFIMM